MLAVSGAAVGRPGEGVRPPLSLIGTKETAHMTAAMAMPGNTADTFLVHFFGTGLVDERRQRRDGTTVPGHPKNPIQTAMGGHSRPPKAVNGRRIGRRHARSRTR